MLTSPYIRRIDRHAGPSLDEARELLIEAARSLSLNAKLEMDQPEQPE
ncbi:hypothetical protein [Cupriavidus necator]